MTTNETRYDAFVSGRAGIALVFPINSNVPAFWIKLDDPDVDKRFCTVLSPKELQSRAKDWFWVGNLMRPEIVSRLAFEEHFAASMNRVMQILNLKSSARECAEVFEEEEIEGDAGRLPEIIERLENVFYSKPFRDTEKLAQAIEIVTGESDTSLLASFLERFRIRQLAIETMATTWNNDIVPIIGINNYQRILRNILVRLGVARFIVNAIFDNKTDVENALQGLSVQVDAEMAFTIKRYRLEYQTPPTHPIIEDWLERTRILCAT